MRLNKRLNKMKYRQLIFDTLKTKFEGVSDNIIGRLADKLATSADTEEAN